MARESSTLDWDREGVSERDVDGPSWTLAGQVEYR